MWGDRCHGVNALQKHSNSKYRDPSLRSGWRRFFVLRLVLFYDGCRFDDDVLLSDDDFF